MELLFRLFSTKEDRPKIEDIERLNQNLKRIHVGDHNIESLLNTFILINYINSFEKISFTKLFITCIKYIKSYLASVVNNYIHEKKLIVLDVNMPLLTFISSKRHIEKMNMEVYDILNSQTNVLLLGNNQFATKPKGCIIEKSNIANRLNLIKSNNRNNELISKTLKCFSDFLKQNQLSSWRIISFSIHLRYQLAYLLFYDTIFAHSQPTFILTESDRYNQVSALVISGKKYKIPSFTQVHGLLNVKYAYVPVLANFIFCWGLEQKKKLISWGEPESTIFITGAVQLENKLYPEKHIVDKFSSKKILLLATNPMNANVRNKLINEFKTCINYLSDEWIGLIRLHPSEELQSYEYILNNNSRIILSNNSIISYNNALSMATMVVIYNSAFAIDAMIKEKPTCQLNIDNEFLGSIKDIIEQDIVPSFETGFELSAFCTEYNQKQNKRIELKSKQKKFIKEYCKFFGKEAALEMINIIKQKQN